jgi:pimeloyl-ACP methyl ester carboxylesterase
MPRMSARSAFDHPLVSERYFFPRPDAPRTVRSIDAGDAVLACAEHRAGRDRPLLVHFHGNGETVADYVPEMAEAFAAAGIDTFFVEYRGYGASTGAPALVAMLDDVSAVIDALDVRRERTFVYGRSIGSIYAIEAARRYPTLAGLILESGLASPLERVLLRIRPHEIGVTREELEEEAARHLDHRAKLERYPGPVLVMHATHDAMVDKSHAESNARWARRSELVLFPQGDHNSILAMNGPAIVGAVKRFVDGALRQHVVPDVHR